MKLANTLDLGVVKNYCKLEMKVIKVAYHKETEMMDMTDLKSKLSDRVACVYFENPIYLGALEEQAADIVKAAHGAGALAMVGVDPTL